VAEHGVKPLCRADLIAVTFIEGIERVITVMRRWSYMKTSIRSVSMRLRAWRAFSRSISSAACNLAIDTGPNAVAQARGG
jgi:hypothetical protein